MTETENRFVGGIISSPDTSDTRRCLMLFANGDNSFDTLDLFCCLSFRDADFATRPSWDGLARHCQVRVA